MPHSAAEFLHAGFLPTCRSDVTSMTEGFTPADFALAAQRAAQMAFERGLAGEETRVTEADCLAAISATRPSVDADATPDFELEQKDYARL